MCASAAGLHFLFIGFLVVDYIRLLHSHFRIYSGSQKKNTLMSIRRYHLLTQHEVSVEARCDEHLCSANVMSGVRASCFSAVDVQQQLLPHAHFVSAEICQISLQAGLFIYWSVLCGGGRGGQLFYAAHRHNVVLPTASLGASGTVRNEATSDAKPFHENPRFRSEHIKAQVPTFGLFSPPPFQEARHSQTEECFPTKLHPLAGLHPHDADCSPLL